MHHTQVHVQPSRAALTLQKTLTNSARLTSDARAVGGHSALFAHPANVLAAAPAQQRHTAAVRKTIWSGTQSVPSTTHLLRARTRPGAKGTMLTSW
jgi:hypothetical protein